VTDAVPPRLRKLWRELAKVDGFMEGASIFSESDDERAYFVNGTQVAHADGSAFELRLTRKVISEHRTRLKAEANVVLRRNASDWLVIDVQSQREYDLVIELAPAIAHAHLPANGGPPKPPPEGADLARRRRFH
jgi:hypothetical protein